MKKFLTSAGFLAIAGLVSKIIGAAYKVPLVGVLGGEGIGIYQLVFPLYTVLLTVSGGGVPLAVSRTTARSRAVGNIEQTYRVLKLSMISFAIAGAIGSVLLALCGGVLARFQGNSTAQWAYVALSPSVFIVSILAVLRGWWQGRNNMFPTALSQLIEQIIKLIAGLFLAKLLSGYGVGAAVAGAVGGITLSEIIALVTVLIITATMSKKSDKLLTSEADLPQPIRCGDTVSPENSELMNCLDNAESTVRKVMEEKPLTDSELLREIWKCALPISLSGLIIPLMQLLDSVMVVNLLMRMGSSPSEATAIFGAATAPVSALLNLPTILTVAACSAAVPGLSAAIKKGKDTNEITTEVFKWASVAASGGFVLFALFADNIVRFLYGYGLTEYELELSVKVLQISSITLPYVCYSQILSAHMQVCDKAMRAGINLMIGAVLKVFVTVALVPLIGIEGSAFASVLACMITFILNYISSHKSIRLNKGSLTAPIMTAAISGCIGQLINILPIEGVIGNLLPLVVFAITYGVLAMATGIVKCDKINSLMKKILARVIRNKSKSIDK